MLLRSGVPITERERRAGCQEVMTLWPAKLLIKILITSRNPSMRTPGPGDLALTDILMQQNKHIAYTCGKTDNRKVMLAFLRPSTPTFEPVSVSGSCKPDDGGRDIQKLTRPLGSCV